MNQNHEYDLRLVYIEAIAAVTAFSGGKTTKIFGIFSTDQDSPNCFRLALAFFVQERYQLQRYQATVVCGNFSASNFDMGLYEIFFAGEDCNMKKCHVSIVKEPSPLNIYTP